MNLEPDAPEPFPAAGAIAAGFTTGIVWGQSVMRQVGDMLVWLAMILIVAAVVYYTPQLASYVSAKDTRSVPRSVAWHGMHHLDQAPDADDP